ncbi:MAG: DUF1206 domain-containing protein [Microthrixaceae bacterium]
MNDTVQRAQQMTAAHGTQWKDRLGRIGLAGRGVLYAIVGLLALQLAFGSADEEASTDGAMAWIAERPFGKFLLVALTVSLFALAAWRFLDAAVGDPVEGDEASDRVRFAAKGVVYLALAVAALSTTAASWNASSSSSGGGETEQRAADTVLDWPMGQWLVALGGLALIGYAVYMFKRHVLDATFMERLDSGSDAVERLGRAGYAARSVVWAVIGVLLIQAAMTYDPEQAGGLSSALQELAAASWGRLLLIAVAAGLFAFGAFCVAEARFRRAA